MNSLSPNQRAWRRFRQNRPAVISAWFLAALVVVVVAWPLSLKLASLAGPGGATFAAQHDPDKLSDQQFQPPTA